MGAFALLMTELIEKKRDGEVLSDEEIKWMITEYTGGRIPDYQMSAFLMATYFRGMTKDETLSLTMAMLHSGETLDLSSIYGVKADKHSTGGVGDKTSLVVAPIVSSLGGKVTKMSGRGLGHTGGTVDKLESIPGFNTSLSAEDFISQIDKVGMAVIGQSGNMTPADKKLYALRDVTSTVDSIPLITSSIMSKKLAAGSHSIVLDVKVGSGAFMKTPESARQLAEKMVSIGKKCGRNMAALMTNMDSPLGFAVGNSLEVIEAVNVLRGKEEGDLKTVCVALASEMVSLFNGVSVEEAEKQVEEAISSGRAFEKMKEWIAAQGGDERYIENTDLFEKTAYSHEIRAENDGFIDFMDSEKIGEASVILGAGRASKEDEIDHAAGIIIAKKTGDRIEKGDTLCTLYSNNEKAFAEAEKMYLSSLVVGKEKAEEKPLIYGIVR